MKKTFLAVCLFLSTMSMVIVAQDLKPKSSAQIFHDLKKLNFLGNVLYVAAHPDDENTRLISYLNHELHAQTSYLSLTRGDGGQNLIGSEIRELLGVLRTQELLGARGIDGGVQFFTRANDFGFSKNPEETLEIWNKNEVLSDIVSRIRTLRPDVIINRFDHRTPGSTHGHHTASAMLSMEAFKLSGEASAFTDQLKTTEPWKAKRVLFNSSWWFYGSESAFEKASKAQLLTLDVGVFYPSLGLSNNEIASLASSQHLCQGFGRLNSRGSEKEYLELIAGDLIKDGDLFNGIDTSWERIPEGMAIKKILDPIENDFNFKNPVTHLSDLIAAYELIQEIKDSFWREQKSLQIEQLIKEVAGLYLSFQSNEAYAAPGALVNTQIALLARNTADLKLVSVEISNAQTSVKIPNNTLEINKTTALDIPIKIPTNTNFSNPYWLNETPSLGMYEVTNKTLIGLPESPATFTAAVVLSYHKTLLKFNIPLVYRYAKPNKGELWELFSVLPPLSLGLEEEVVLFSDQKSKKISVTVTALAKEQKGEVFLEVPDNWKIFPHSKSFQLQEKGSSMRAEFEVTAPENEEEIKIKAIAKSNGISYDKKLITIAYDHIPTQQVLQKATAKWVKLSIQKQEASVGYLMGAGDKVPESLAAIGYKVVLLDNKDLTTENLSKFKAVILGVRALNVFPELKLKKSILLKYIKEGGVLISQYNTVNRGGDKQLSITPYPLQLSSDRVTKEDSKVQFLNKNHPVINYPNPLTEKDFNGWIQERGLYFPDQWDQAFVPILEMNDPGESPKQGSLLIAPYDKGHFVYTGLSFFRELPAGVPGAYKLISNLISLKASVEKTPIKN